MQVKGYNDDLQTPPVCFPSESLNHPSVPCCQTQNLPDVTHVLYHVLIHIITLNHSSVNSTGRVNNKSKHMSL